MTNSFDYLNESIIINANFGIEALRTVKSFKKEQSLQIWRCWLTIILINPAKVSLTNLSLKFYPIESFIGIEF